MEKRDLRNKLNDIIKEEITSVLNERSYKYGGLLDPDNFDPIDPEIHVVGFGTLTRSALRLEIAKRLEGAVKTARDASSGSAGSYRKYQQLSTDLSTTGVLGLMIKAELEVADELEERRKKGGRRGTPIPKQY
jgi:hypothetical protein